MVGCVYVRYEYTARYIPVAKKDWSELGTALEELPREGEELFMVLPITSLSALWIGISRSRTTAIIHYFRCPLDVTVRERD